MILPELVQCIDGEATFLGFMNLSFAPDLLYYSYFSIIIISLVIGIFVLIKNGFSSLSKVLFFLTTIFAIFIFNEVVQWIVMPAGLVYFTFSISLLLHFLILISTFYFVYLFVKGKDIPFWGKSVGLLLGLPIILLLPSELNLSGVELDTCTGQTGMLWDYFYGLQFLAVLVFLSWSLLVLKQYGNDRDSRTLSSFYLLLGSFVFVGIFFASFYYAEETGIYEINLIGPLGMLAFIGTLSYLIVRFKAFNIKLVAAQALVASLILLIGSEFFFVESTTTRMLVGVTFLLSCIGGYFLVRSVNREVLQREQIAKLAENLQGVNTRLKELDKMKSEFVSIASHQLRSPLTSIRGYASMLSEGSYGKLPKKATEVVEKIGDSAKYMALSVEDYLNVSRIEAGNMKYEIGDFNLKDMAERIVDEMRTVAIKKGLIMLFRSDCKGSCSVNADVGKTRQIIMNLLDNSMKYTQKGTITVRAHDDVKKKKMFITIEDTGVGMSKETQEEVFEKFVRAKNANNVNVTGTGLGLFVAKKMITDMKGRVWAESDGEGKGSRFHIELPLVPGAKSAK